VPKEEAPFQGKGRDKPTWGPFSGREERTYSCPYKKEPPLTKAQKGWRGGFPGAGKPKNFSPEVRELLSGYGKGKKPGFSTGEKEIKRRHAVFLLLPVVLKSGDAPPIGGWGTPSKGKEGRCPPWGSRNVPPSSRKVWRRRSTCLIEGGSFPLRGERESKMWGTFPLGERKPSRRVGIVPREWWLRRWGEVTISEIMDRKDFYEGDEKRPILMELKKRYE